MEKNIVSQADYEKAIDTINRFRIENVGFYAQMNIEGRASQYFDDFDNLIEAVYLCGVNGDQIEMCFQIDENTFNKNYLPF